MHRPTWHFNSFRRGDQRNDPISHALFSQDEVSDLAGSVVRESIQNSLDARAGSEEVVRVRFAFRRRLAPTVGAISSELNGLWDHLASEGSGLDSPPEKKGSVPVLAIEDFGTTGLIGDLEQWDPLEGDSNGFFLFFHATGTSGKSGESRGRWGVGKFVFPLASRANAWFGLTVRQSEKRPLLMGRCVLKTHRVATTTYHPDGRWGVMDDGFVRPVQDDEAMTRTFTKLCGATRTTEPGLSIVIPWVRDELTARAVSYAVVREYFLPLLRNELVVEIDDDGSVTQLDASSVMRVATEIGEDSLKSLIELAIEVVNFDAAQLVAAGAADVDRSPQWTADLLSSDQLARMQASLDAGKVVGVRVPLRVRPKVGSSSSTYFDVFVRSVDSVGRQYPLIVREGITVPKARTVAINDCVALVLADHGPLVGLIGDSENPAHTELLHKLIADKYVYAKSTLDLLRETPAGIVRALREGESEEDPFLLSDLFPEPEGEGSGRIERKAKRKGVVTPPPPPPPPPRPRRYRIDSLDGGFVVVGLFDDQELPTEMTLSCAYEVRGRSPFKAYDPLDFELSAKEFEVNVVGAENVHAERNRVRLRPIDPHLRVSITGFDKNRDVIVRVELG